MKKKSEDRKRINVNVLLRVWTNQQHVVQADRSTPSESKRPSRRGAPSGSKRNVHVLPETCIICQRGNEWFLPQGTHMCFISAIKFWVMAATQYAYPVGLYYCSCVNDYFWLFSITSNKNHSFIKESNHSKHFYLALLLLCNYKPFLQPK